MRLNRILAVLCAVASVETFIAGDWPLCLLVSLGAVLNARVGFPPIGLDVEKQPNPRNDGS